MVYKPLFLILLLSGIAFADTGYKDTIRITETDGSPACWAGQLKVSPGTLTCGGQTATITTGGGSGGGGGSASTLAVGTGTATGGIVISSPTAVIYFSGSQFKDALTGTATSFVTLLSTQSFSSMTVTGTLYASTFSATNALTILRENQPNAVSGQEILYGDPTDNWLNYVPGDQNGVSYNILATSITASQITPGHFAMFMSTNGAVGDSGVNGTQGTWILNQNFEQSGSTAFPTALEVGADGYFHNYAYSILESTVTILAVSSSVYTNVSSMTLDSAPFYLTNSSMNVISSSTLYGLYVSSGYFGSGSNSIAISSTNEILINGSAGTNNQTLTSGGPGATIKWATGGGGISSVNHIAGVTFGVQDFTSSGSTRCISIVSSGTITSWNIVSDSGTITVGVASGTFTNFQSNLYASLGSIVASDPPAISSQVSAQNTNPSTWLTTLVYNEILCFTVRSVTPGNMTWATVEVGYSSSQ